MSNPNVPEPPPKKNSLPHVWDLVIQDMKDRKALGEDKYGMALQPFNGRDSWIDAYQEALDLAVYLRQKIYEIEYPECRPYPKRKPETETGSVPGLSI